MYGDTVVMRTGLAAHPYLLGARAADAAGHPALRAGLDRLADLGYLSRR